MARTPRNAGSPEDSHRRVLIISSYMGRPESLLGGGETYAEQLAGQLSDRGHDIIIGCWQSGTVSLTRIMKKLPSRQVRVRSAIDLVSIASLVGIIRRDRIDLVIANSPKEYWPAVIASRLTGRKVILVRHLTRRISLATRTLINSSADCVIAVSRSVRRELELSGIRENIIREVYNGVPVERIREALKERESTRAETGYLPGDLVIGFAGRLHPEKGLDCLIAAFGRIARHYPQARLLIVGDGRERQTMLRAAAGMHLEDRVRFTGRIDPVYRMYAAMDIFVMPSICEEAFGFAAAEAMAMGRPVIASNSGGLAELITHEVDGLLVRPGDPESLTTALIRLIENPEERRSFAARGLETVTNRYSDRLQGNLMNDLILAISGTRA
ncbi:MAG: glycosyltransferase [Nitrospiraceae bacterium]|nr:glycosyltransferase [Nitrospiraceae bacterium]